MLLLQVILIGLNAIFACAEIAVISINEQKVEKLAEEGNKKAKKLKKLKNDPARFLATIQVAITLSGFLGSAFAAENFSDYLSNWLISLGLNMSYATLDTIVVIAITLILSYFTLVLGELVPKRIAMRKAETLGLKMATLISVISKLFAPIVFLLTKSTNLVLRLFGINPNDVDEKVSEEDIQLLVEAGNKEGVLDDDEKEIIQNVFEFDDITAMDVGTHRTDVVMLWKEEFKNWDKIIRDGDHSVYPICKDSQDNIVGVLRTKDYFRLPSFDEESVEKIIKEPYFVPETVKADLLFKNMKQSKNFFGIVVDEYGGTSGIVTMNDLIEALIGDIETTEDEEEKGEIKQGEDENGIYYEVIGNVLLEDVEKVLAVKFEETECDTFSGYVLERIGSIPKDIKIKIEINNLLIEILEIDEYQIIRSIVRFLKESD
ncbi:MAG: HlyC/CorC family transporter [Clostridiales bacterium]|nr:HlyC/CorC family transporter [Clostridiales bacterium]